MPLRVLGVGAALVAVLLVVKLRRRPLAVRETDHDIIFGLRGAGPEWLRRAAIDLTALGGGIVLTLVVVAAAGLLLARRLPLTAAPAGRGGERRRVVALVKDAVARARPAAGAASRRRELSFPSAHAANSAIVYLTLAALAAR